MDVPSVAHVAVRIAVRVHPAIGVGPFGPTPLLGAPALLLVLEAAAGLLPIQPSGTRRLVGSLPVLPAVVLFGFAVVASGLLAAAPASGVAFAVLPLVVLVLAAALLVALRAAITLVSGVLVLLLLASVLVAAPLALPSAAVLPTLLALHILGLAIDVAAALAPLVATVRLLTLASRSLTLG